MGLTSHARAAARPPRPTARVVAEGGPLRAARGRRAARVPALCRVPPRRPSLPLWFPSALRREFRLRPLSAAKMPLPEAVACKFCRRSTGRGSLNALLLVAPRSSLQVLSEVHRRQFKCLVAGGASLCNAQVWPKLLGRRAAQGGAPCSALSHSLTSGQSRMVAKRGLPGGRALRRRRREGRGRGGTKKRERVRRRSAVGYSGCLTASLGGGRLRGSRPAW